MGLLQDIPNSMSFKLVYSHTKAQDYIKIDNAIAEMLKTKQNIISFKINKNNLLPSIFNGIPGIYILFNKTNNRVYVGQSGNIYRRVLSHKNSMLKRALKANDEIILKIIPICEQQLRNFWERWFIKYYQLRYESCNNSSVLIDNIDEYTFTPNKEDCDA